MYNWMTRDLIKQGKLVRCLPEWTSSQHEESSAIYLCFIRAVNTQNLHGKHLSIYDWKNYLQDNFPIQVSELKL
ncbi:MAG: hypothetical protein HRU25_12760 [Psychrobium sp.]|nr:hypothetical protein [Psychrobium sp.]